MGQRDTDGCMRSTRNFVDAHRLGVAHGCGELFENSALDLTSKMMVWKATVLTEHIESDGFQRADEHRDCRHTGPSRANVGRQRRNQKADDQLSHGRGPTTPSQTFYPTLCETIGKSATVRGRTAR
jgi:hypothetical protein